MRGLLLLSDPHHAQMNPDRMRGEAQRLGLKVHCETAAEMHPPLFLSRCQLQFSRLRRHCDWVCVLAEGDAAACGMILAAQLPVDRLILLGDRPFCRRHPNRRLRRINAFALRNLSLITAGIIAAGMDGRALRRLSASLGFQGEGLICLQDAAELWQKRESFLTEPFPSLAASSIYAK